jgi:two-component system sensor histidine kinase PilS (NtrC family)
MNLARGLVVSATFAAVLAIDVVFEPEEWSSAAALAVCGTAWIWTALLAAGARSPGHRLIPLPSQVAGDVALCFGLVLATGGGASPLSFLLALPVMAAAGLLGLQGGLLTATGVWLAFALLLARDVWMVPASELPPGRVLYVAVTHLVGFLSLGIFGGVLADRVRSTGRELEKRKGALANLQAMHRHIVESITTGLLTTDLNGRTTFVNRAGVELLGGVGPEDGDALTTLGLPADVLGQAQEHLSSGRRYRFERSWTRPSDGRRLLLGFSVSALADRTSLPIGWLIVFQDLTEIASLEEQVRTKERMAALGEMAAGMAHELRNPLAAISGCVQVLERDEIAGEGDSAQLRKVVVRESQRLDRIIRDFLEFARPSRLRPRPSDLAQLMEEMARLMRSGPHSSPIHRIDVIPGPGPTVALADPDGMRQVFWNLASNAQKAMPEGGTITIRVCGHGGDRVLVEFRDEGHGMDSETVQRYFQPFHGRFERGTGLGAAIVYRIVEEHGGQVQVVSGQERGTSIRVILPAAPAITERTETPAELAGSAAGG